jgi:hypothetical protein
MCMWHGGVQLRHDLGQCSHLHMSSLTYCCIGAAGARDLGEALQVNVTLTTLK